jgi:hypothetical protein
MMKKITMIAGALSLALFCAPAQASRIDSCNYGTDFDLKVENSIITFNQDSGTEIIIDQDNHLFINGAEKQLDNGQQQLIDDYSDGVRDLIPEVTAIALEGVSLGVGAASMALGILLGEGDPDYERFNYKISELADSITIKLDANNFNSKQLEDVFGSDFENQIESVVEEAVAELTPRLMAKIVTAAMAGDSDGISSFEDRANSLEDEIEAFVQPKADAIEARAEELCSSIEVLDSLETQMVESGLDMMDLINEESHDHHHKSKDKNYSFHFGD